MQGVLKMNQIEGTELFEFDPELVEIKARWLSSKYSLPYDRVFKILERTVIKEPIHAFEYEPDEVTTAELVYYLQFSPCLEEALTFLDPEVALTFFESERNENIVRWMKQALTLIRKYSKSSSFLLDVSK